MINWTGVFPAVTTKLKADGSLDLDATRRSVDRLVVNGVSAVIMLPMLGENASLRADEREAVIEAARDVVAGRVPVLTGLADLSEDAAAAAARDYRRMGVDGLMLFPSLAYRTDPRETVAWYRAVGAASDLPIMIYNNPLAYRVDVGPDELEALADVDTIMCVKEECGDPRRITDIYNRVGDRYAVFCGIDDLIVESVAVGAVGWVSGMTNVWPAECVALFEMCKADRYAEARALYRLLMPAFHLDTSVKLVQYIKFAEHLVYGAPEHVRRPRLDLVGEERAEVGAVVKAAIAALKQRAAKAA
ncbi:dihydrodipicolinate synthase family protein [Nitratireductor alexandrii]|uniref:dihydrodipicolinate synthase family protein n=1 Tax=Nitratireductor alexandrii TaxID=2448161 RepID=UPI000FDA0A49|nr:dihydrodipicolinate synthase family protein [Nitratireductor alexandrii]